MLDMNELEARLYIAGDPAHGLIARCEDELFEGTVSADEAEGLDATIESLRIERDATADQLSGAGNLLTAIEETLRAAAPLKKRQMIALADLLADWTPEDYPQTDGQIRHITAHVCRALGLG